MKNKWIIILLVFFTACAKKEETPAQQPVQALQVVIDGEVKQSPQLVSGEYFANTKPDLPQGRLVLACGVNCGDTLRLTFPLVKDEDLTPASRQAIFEVKDDSKAFLYASPFTIHLSVIEETPVYILVSGDFKCKGVRSGGRQIDMAGYFKNVAIKK